MNAFFNRFFAGLAQFFMQLLGQNQGVEVVVPIEIRRRIAIRFQMEHVYNNYANCIRHWVQTGVVELAAADYNMKAFTEAVSTIASIGVEYRYSFTCLSVPILNLEEGTGYALYPLSATPDSQDVWLNYLNTTVQGIVNTYLNGEADTKPKVTTLFSEFDEVKGVGGLGVVDAS